MNTNHKLAALVACALAGCLLAACGSASSSSSSSSSGSSGAAASTGTAARTKLVACLKQHGVTLPTRPGSFRRPNSGSGSNGSGTPPAGGFFGGGAGGGSGGGFGGGSGGRFRNNPKFQTAFKACGANFPARRFNPAQRKVEIDNFVKCVRQHGYDLPTPNLSGSGPVFQRSIESNKKFETAAKSCASVLAPRGGPPPGGQTTTASSTA